MKEISKARVIQSQSVKAVMNELEIMKKVQGCASTAKLHYAFQDKANLYLVMDLLKGGDLFYHLKHNGYKFSMQVTKFFVACMLQGLEGIHGQNIVHRDIKPENLVFDSQGYLFLTDFGLSHIAAATVKRDSNGTASCMAPEIIQRKTRGLASDFYSVGVIAYVCMQGRFPYNGNIV